MTRARDIANLVDANGDIVAGALDNVPASNDASALTTGTLAAARLPTTGVDASSLSAGTLPVDRVPYFTNRNLMVNGGMEISQRGTTFSTAVSGTHLVDRWAVLANVNGASKITYSQSSEAPAGLRKSIKLDVVTALTPASGDYHIFKYSGFEQHNIDHLAFGTSDAEQVTLSFWVKSNKTGTLVAELQYNSVEAGGSSVELGKPYTINSANTWERKILTFAAPTNHTSNAASGTSNGLKLYMWISAGSAYQGASIDTTWGVNTNRVAGQDNYLDSASNEIYFTGFQLEAGNTATPFEVEDHGTTFRKCQRFYHKAVGSKWLFDLANSNSYRRGVEFFPATMRATPTVTITYSGSPGSGRGVQHITNHHCNPYVDNESSYTYYTQIEADAEY